MYCPTPSFCVHISFWSCSCCYRGGLVPLLYGRNLPTHTACLRVHPLSSPAVTSSCRPEMVGTTWDPKADVSIRLNICRSHPNASCHLKDNLLPLPIIFLTALQWVTTCWKWTSLKKGFCWQPAVSLAVSVLPEHQRWHRAGWNFVISGVKEKSLFQVAWTDCVTEPWAGQAQLARLLPLLCHSRLTLGSHLLHA